MTEAEFGPGPAEDRLRRVIDELRAVTAEVRATPYLAGVARERLRVTALAVAEETKRLATAVVAACHRAPGPEDA